VQAFEVSSQERSARAGSFAEPSINTDISVSKYFKLPFEGHRVEARAEAFNAFNNVNFSSPATESRTPEHFGPVFRARRSARVMQFALRYEF